MTKPVADPPAGLGPRVAAFLRERYPRDRAKLIGRDFSVSPGTAERWLAGYAPAVWHIEAMYEVFGEAFARSLFVEAFAGRDARLQQLERALIEQRRQTARLAEERERVQEQRPSDTAEQGGVAYSSRSFSALRIPVVPRLLEELVATIPPEPATTRFGRPLRFVLQRFGGES